MQFSKKFVSKIVVLASAILAFSPALAFAQSFNTGYLTNTGQSITTLINTTIIPLFIAIAVVGFIYSAIAYFFGGKDEGKHTLHRQQMIWGIVAIFVIVSIWGFVNILQNIFLNGNSNPTVTLPTVPTQ